MWLQEGLYVRIKQLQGDRAPRPLPLESGFSTNRAYRVLGMYNPSESGDAWYILCNDRNETWFICTRHIEIYKLDPGNYALNYGVL